MTRSPRSERERTNDMPSRPERGRRNDMPSRPSASERELVFHAERAAHEHTAARQSIGYETLLGRVPDHGERRLLAGSI